MRLGNPFKALVAGLRKAAEHMNPRRLVLTHPAQFKTRRDNTSGLAIRALRMAGHAFPTKRMGRSKYMPNGVPARITKRARKSQALPAAV